MILRLKPSERNLLLELFVRNADGVMVLKIIYALTFVCLWWVFMCVCLCVCVCVCVCARACARACVHVWYSIVPILSSACHLFWTSLLSVDPALCNPGRPSRQWAKSRRRPDRASSQSGSGKTPPPDQRQRHRSMSEMTKSPSSEHGPRKNNVDLRARYWKFLFDNFQRAVDGIYQTCEQDESVVECKVCSYSFFPCFLVSLVAGCLLSS